MAEKFSRENSKSISASNERDQLTELMAGEGKLALHFQPEMP